MSLLSDKMFTTEDTDNHKKGESKNSIACNHNCRTSAADLGQIARSGHSDVELWPLAANDWTIDIRFIQRGLQLPATSAAAAASFAKFAGLASRRQQARGNKSRSVYNFFTGVQQP